ncbi:MAG: endo alpha-1,4 polygalactosaminidase [Deltaproteobacteria bacterium]|nr:endo alpha-1,4 polygalactosaminidase [Deltaproteobacteria bacterium]
MMRCSRVRRPQRLATVVSYLVLAMAINGCDSGQLSVSSPDSGVKVDGAPIVTSDSGLADGPTSTLDRGNAFDSGGSADGGSRTDSRVVTPPIALCGDGICASGESATSCNYDCPQRQIWRPAPGVAWQWQLSGQPNPSLAVKMFDIDLFTTTAAKITQLKANGRVVICYFSAGSWESDRPDSGDFPDKTLGSKMQGWPEYWIDIRSSAVRQVMEKRLDLAKTKGCDGVEPDNVDGYDNKNGFGLTKSHQLDYNIFLAKEAHKRGLSIGLKNDLGQIKQLEPYFDWALNEECVRYQECGELKPFIDAGKAVFHVEYKPMTVNEACSGVKGMHFDTLIKNLDLDAWRGTCS